MSDSLVTQLLQQSIDQNEHLTDPVTGALIVRLLQQSIAQNEKILEEHAKIKTAFASHAQNEETVIRGLLAAFPKKPDGSPDFEGHEIYHSALIEESRARTVFYRGLRYKLLEKGFWTIIVVLGALISYWWAGHTNRNP